jgi:hypothetical protein
MLSSVNLPGGVQVGVTSCFSRKVLRLFQSGGNLRATNFKCGTSLKKGTSWLQKFRHSSRTAQCLCTLGHSNMERYFAYCTFRTLYNFYKLRNGQLVTIPPVLVRRLKSHFITLPCGVDLILGLNGYIWVSKHVKENEQEGEEGFDAEAVYSNQNDVCTMSFFSAQPEY